MLPLKDKVDNYNSVTPGNYRIGKTHMSISPQPQMSQQVMNKMKDVTESKSNKTWNISTKVKKPIYSKKELEEKKAALTLAAKQNPGSQRAVEAKRTRTSERTNMVTSSEGQTPLNVPINMSKQDPERFRVGGSSSPRYKGNSFKTLPSQSSPPEKAKSI